MDLYLLRHGDAADSGTNGIADDADRPLTRKGRKDIEKVAQSIRHMGISIDVIVSSPYLRARETAELVGEVLGTGLPINLTSDLALSGKPALVVRQIDRNYSAFKSILLVGHEPLLAELISVLISGRRDAALRIRKGGLCKLTVGMLHAGKCATLDFLMAPSQLP